MNIPTQALMMEAQNVCETTVFGRTLTRLIAGGISTHLLVVTASNLKVLTFLVAHTALLFSGTVPPVSLLDHRW